MLDPSHPEDVQTVPAPLSPETEHGVVVDTPVHDHVSIDDMPVRIFCGEALIVHWPGPVEHPGVGSLGPVQKYTSTGTVSVAVGGGGAWVVTLTVGCALCDKAPDVPVIVKLEAPVAALAEAARVNCDVPLPPATDVGLNDPLKPVVKFDFVSETVPVKPFSGDMVTVYATLDP